MSTNKSNSTPQDRAGTAIDKSFMLVGFLMASLPQFTHAPHWIRWSLLAMGLLLMAVAIVRTFTKPANSGIEIPSEFVAKNVSNSTFKGIHTNADTVFGGDISDSYVENVHHYRSRNGKDD